MGAKKINASQAFVDDVLPVDDAAEEGRADGGDGTAERADGESSERNARAKFQGK